MGLIKNVPGRSILDYFLHIKIKLYGHFNPNLWTKNLDPFLGHFWVIETKIKMNMKKRGTKSSNFQFSISKLGFMELFLKISEKRFFLKFLPAKDPLRQRCQKG